MNWIKSNLLKLMAVALLVAAVISFVLWNLYKDAKQEAKQQSSNVENLMLKHNQVLSLTTDQYKKSEEGFKTTIDSLLKANKQLKLKSLKQVIITNTVYQDTGSVQVIHAPAKPVGNKTLQIPFEANTLDGCWGVKGDISTTDPKARVKIKEKLARSGTQYVIVQKRFLGFLWRKKPEKPRVFSDCGEPDYIDIKFVKK